MKPPFSNKRFPPFQGTDIHTYIHTYMHTCFIYLEPYTIKKESYEAPEERRRKKKKESYEEEERKL